MLHRSSTSSFFEDGIPDETLLPCIVDHVFHADISRPRVSVDDPQTLVRRQEVNLMQCACSRNSALFMGVPLLEVKTRHKQFVIRYIMLTGIWGQNRPGGVTCV
jgi:hypothetical protein